MGQGVSKCREDQIAGRVPTPDAGQRIEASGEVDGRTRRAEEIDGVGLMYQDVSTNYAIERIGVGK